MNLIAFAAVFATILGTPVPGASQPDSIRPGDHLYRGAQGQLDVQMPRVEEAEIRIDGDLDEPHWADAAVLTEFTQFDPVEGGAASESTEVRLFYTPRALYIGIRAGVSDRSRLRATLADRDNILRDDHIQILLDTFHDRRRAFAIYVNPLGIQQDGIYNEGSGGGRRGDDRVDFSPDLLFESRGRVTDEGYVVELRIPFKSLKFSGAQQQSWGINVIRKIAATGAEEAWAPLSRNQPSRLAQSGTLMDLSELRPGRLFELNPVVTGKRVGASSASGFERGGFDPDFGLNVKYGLTSNLTLDATYNPDFSQVEADVGQITVNERFAVFFPERRPFFLEGADLFSTPEPLVYTRSIVDPIAGAKLTGKVGNLAVGYLGALDESPLRGGSLAPQRSHALFNIARVTRDVGPGSSVGAVITDRELADQYNRVVGLDGRLRFRRVYTAEFQLANSWTRRWRRDAEGTHTAQVGEEAVPVSAVNDAGHLFQAALDRSGRNWGFRVQAKDIPQDFRAQSGFVRRTGVTDFFLFTRYSVFGKPGGLLESWGPWLMANRIYDGRDFWRGGDPAEGMARLRVNFNLRGNNRITLGASDQFYVLNPDRYARYSYTSADGRVRTGDEAIRDQRELSGLRGLSLEARSSYFKKVSFGGEFSRDETPIFAEGTPGVEWSARGSIEMRPTNSLRLDTSLRHARLYRESTGSLYSEALLPRLKLEYQLNRAVFVRAVGQYSIEEVDVLRAPDGSPYLRNGEPFRVRGGQLRDAELLQTNPMRMDLLFSYQPSPGTLIFLGYGREMSDREAFHFPSLEPRADGLFLKLSYLFRS